MNFKRLIPFALLCGCLASAQTKSPLVQPHWTFFDQSGAACAGCSLYSYLAGTTTPTPTYTDASGGSTNTNPIILDASGSANIWVGTPTLKLVLKDTFGTTIWTVDNIPPGGGGVSVCGPASTIQIANSTVTGLTCDSLITINTVNHTINVGGPLPANHFSLTNLSPVASSWTLNVTSPTTAALSVGGGTAGAGKYIDGGTGNWTNLPAPGTGTMTSYNVTVPAGLMTASGCSVTTSGTCALGLNPTGSATEEVTAAAPGTVGQYGCWDASGNLSGSTSPCTPGTLLDQYGTVTGCTFPNDGGGLSCTGLTITWPVAFANSTYLVGCWPMYSFAIAGGSSTQPVIDLNVTINTVSQITLTEGVAQGSSGGFGVSPNYGLTIVCHAHHN